MCVQHSLRRLSLSIDLCFFRGEILTLLRVSRWCTSTRQRRTVYVDSPPLQVRGFFLFERVSRSGYRKASAPTKNEKKGGKARAAVVYFRPSSGTGCPGLASFSVWYSLHKKAGEHEHGQCWHARSVHLLGPGVIIRGQLPLVTGESFRAKTEHKKRRIICARITTHPPICVCALFPLVMMNHAEVIAAFFLNAVCRDVPRLLKMMEPGPHPGLQHYTPNPKRSPFKIPVR